MRVRVLVRPKRGILDPQGQAVERALPALGFEGARNVLRPEQQGWVGSSNCPRSRPQPLWVTRRLYKRLFSEPQPRLLTPGLWEELATLERRRR